MHNAFLAILLRDLKLYHKDLGECFKPILFFVMIASLFPILSTNQIYLKELTPAIFWISLSIANIISLEGILKHDFEDGSLLQLLLSPHPLAILILGKLIAHWLAIGIPLSLIAPVLALFLNLSWEGVKGLLTMILFTFPILSLIGTMGASLLVGLRQGGLLLAIIVLPLNIPILIFATSGTKAASLGLPFVGEIALLAAIFLLLIMIVPITISYILRNNVP